MNDDDTGGTPGPAEEGDTETEPVATGPEPPQVDADPRRPASRYRRPAFAIGGAVLVLVAAAVGYQAVIPTVHVDRARLSRLVPSRSGIAAYDRIKAQAGAQDDTQTGLAAVTAAAKTAPDRTGLYSIEWSPANNAGAGIVAFLLPSDAIAATTLAQVRTQQLAPSSYASEALTRRSTASVGGIPGSAESTYTPSTKSSPVSTLVVTVFRTGRVVAVAEVVNTGGARADAEALARREFATIGHVEPGFSLRVTDRPIEASAWWAAGAVFLAAVVALGPIGWRRRAVRRRRRREEELARHVVVGGQVIVKHHR